MTEILSGVETALSLLTRYREVAKNIEDSEYKGKETQCFLT